MKGNRASTGRNLRLWAGQNYSQEVTCGSGHFFSPFFSFFWEGRGVVFLCVRVHVCMIHFGIDVGRAPSKHQRNTAFIIPSVPYSRACAHGVLQTDFSCPAFVY